VIRRREFITLLGGTATAWPLVARAQTRDKFARIGFLRSSSEPRVSTRPAVGDQSNPFKGK